MANREREAVGMAERTKRKGFYRRGKYWWCRVDPVTRSAVSTRCQRQAENLTNLNTRVNQLGAARAYARCEIAELTAERDAARTTAGELVEKLAELTGKLTVAEIERDRAVDARIGLELEVLTERGRYMDELEKGAKLLLENGRLREALGFYAAAETWIYSREESEDSDIVEVDGEPQTWPGKRAREALRTVPL